MKTKGDIRPMLMTPLDSEEGVEGQSQQLEKIPRP